MTIIMRILATTNSLNTSPKQTSFWIKSGRLRKSPNYNFSKAPMYADGIIMTFEYNLKSNIHENVSKHSEAS